MSKGRKPCQKCTAFEATPGFRFCATCRKELRKGMEEAGYFLPPPPRPRKRRPSEMEDVGETKHGIDD